MKTKLAISILTLAQSLSPVLASPLDFAVPQDANPNVSGTPAQCTVKGSYELTITCDYTAGAAGGTQPRIILNRAMISFETSNDSNMEVELTFTNGTDRKIAVRRAVYLEINDDKGGNHLRRFLPHVDFTKLEPGKPFKFREMILSPGYPHGAYVASIWIPSVDPSMKFDAAQNFLLSSNGVPDAATGLNQIAKFTVVAPTSRKPASKPE
jgi:hypothetical protein